MVNSETVIMDPSWKNILVDEFQKPYFDNIKLFLEQEKKQWQIIYPKWPDIFNAFNTTTFDHVKVVILGQDPYHGEWEAHWLCFSVQDGIKHPPSLKNIFKELESDLWYKPPISWNLSKRANQWVFLLNSILTVRKDSPASHKDIWWNIFTDAVIKKLSDNTSWLVFLLRWNFAQSKDVLIDKNKHLILKSAHPSPFSVYRGFFWCKHFSQTNTYLQSFWRDPIDWNLS